MKKLAFMAMGLVAVVVTNLSAQVGPAISTSTPVNDFAATSYTMDVVHRLAAEYHIVIGAYGTMLGVENQTIDISIKNGTLGETLDAITKADPRFEWHPSGTSTIHLVTRSSPLTRNGRHCTLIRDQ